ncbi:GNAT family N-acetyltransferase [Kineococcus sp. GCM10028916]|uniref:GNAT family N-acetyltransferase n=1 Tax=Kineococcus sp. GCM10028916 TaxID=3273394 RepID=UPI003639A62F
MATPSPPRLAPYLSRALSTLRPEEVRSRGGAMCVDPDQAAFAVLRQPLDPSDWRDLGSIAGDVAVLELDPGIAAHPPWVVRLRFPATIMVFAPSHLETAPDARVRVLGDHDLEDIRVLARRSGNEHFPERGLRFGHHVGVHLDGRLVAMAGRRFVIDDHVEISWVGSDPGYRRLGLGTAVVAAVCQEILAEGKRPYLVVADGNPAFTLYERLGFVPVERIDGTVVTRESQDAR